MLETAGKIVKKLAERGETISFAESCTGGLLTKLITDVPGASRVLPGGVCSYSNEVKERVLGVQGAILGQYGAVSAPVAIQMARGVKKLLGSDWGVGTTGIAGPSSDDTKKPVGLVYIGLALPGGRYIVRQEHFSGNRDEIRSKTAEAALSLVDKYIVDKNA